MLEHIQCHIPHDLYIRSFLHTSQSSYQPSANDIKFTYTNMEQGSQVIHMSTEEGGGGWQIPFPIPWQTLHGRLCQQGAPQTLPLTNDRPLPPPPLVVIPYTCFLSTGILGFPRSCAKLGVQGGQHHCNNI